MKNTITKTNQNLTFAQKALKFLQNNSVPLMFVLICIVCILLEPLIPHPLFSETHLLSYVTMAVMTVMTLWSGIDYLRLYWPYIGQTK